MLRVARPALNPNSIRDTRMELHNFDRPENQGCRLSGTPGVGSIILIPA